MCMCMCFRGHFGDSAGIKTPASSRFCDLKCIMGMQLRAANPEDLEGSYDILTSTLLSEFRISSDYTTDGYCRSSGKRSQDVFGEFSFVFLSSLDMFCGGLTR